MDELDARLRAMAHRERPSPPQSYEEAMEALEDRARAGRPLRPAARRQGRRVLLLAAAAAALLAATAASVEFWHVRMGEVEAGAEESRYTVEADLPRIPMEAFSDQVEAALAEINQAFQLRRQALQNRDYSVLASSHYPGDWSQEMDTWTACEEFLGFSLTNPLEEQPELAPRTLNAHGEPFRPYEVALLGSADGRLEYVSVSAIYDAGETGVSLRVILLPEGAEDGALAAGTVWRGEVDFDTDSARTGSGAPVTVVVPEVREHSYYHVFSSAESYFILGQGLYMLDVSIPGTAEAEARAALEELLALF